MQKSVKKIKKWYGVKILTKMVGGSKFGENGRGVIKRGRGAGKVMGGVKIWENARGHQKLWGGQRKW